MKPTLTTIRTVTIATAAIVLLSIAGCSRPQTTLVAPFPDAYHPEDDVYVMFQGEIFEDASDLLPAEVIGQKAFELQEGVHADITDVSGAEVDHYYIWVCLGNDCLPVDPFRFSN